VLGKESWLRKNFPSALCRVLLSAKALPSVWCPLLRVSGPWQSLDFQ
jgi:hypothetical protein